MNGRIYDPLLGRMLSADILVQFPNDAQSYNRYSYVRNNPLGSVDSSGFNEVPMSVMLNNASLQHASRTNGWEDRQKAEALAVPAAMKSLGWMGVGFTPGVGDGVGMKQNYDTVLNPRSADWELGLVAVDSILTGMSLGFAPNLMPLRRAVGEMFDAAHAAGNQAKQTAHAVGSIPPPRVEVEAPKPELVEVSGTPPTKDIGGGGGSGGFEAPSSSGSGAGDYVFRGDTRSPDLIFDQGFTSKGDNMDLRAHAFGDPTPPSGYVATSLSPDVASAKANNVYVIRNEGGIDVNAVLGSRSPYPDEREIAFKYKIEASDIRAMTDTQRGVSILNPNWKP